MILHEEINALLEEADKELKMANAHIQRAREAEQEAVMYMEYLKESLESFKKESCK